VDIGGSKVLAVLSGAEGEVLAQAKLPTPGEVGAVVEAVLEAAAQVGDPERALPLGVGCPGMIDAHGTAHFCPHLHCLDGVAFERLLSERRVAGARTVVVNDATAACWAEHQVGAGRGVDDLLMVTLGTGIGGGMVVGGRLVTGAHGFAGELGHMVAVPSGPACPCGKKGCWERFASGSGLGRLAREAAEAGRLQGVLAEVGGTPGAIRGEHVTMAAARRDPEALAVMEELAWWVALGLANLANVLDPAVIVIGGGLIEVGPALMEPLGKAFAQLVECAGARQVRLVPAALGERAGAVGAALLAAGAQAGR
jgi:glucokinase